MKKTIIIFTILLIFSCNSLQNKNEVDYDYLDSNLSTDRRVEILLDQMTLDEKIGQMTQVERNSLEDTNHIASYHLGSVLSGGGSSPGDLQAWRNMIRSMQDIALSTRLRIPILYGTDAVHGHGNLRGSVIFPHNINLGAANDPELVKKIGEITALEMRISGTNYNFAPCLAVSRDERWGRTYESYSEDHRIVSSLGAAFVEGQQDGWPHKGVATSIKHFVGDGSTDKGKDRALSIISEDELRNIHLYPYIESIKAGAASVMISQHSWNNIEMHGHCSINQILKGELNFKGFVISDWAGIDQIPGDYISDVEKGINAGIDLIMVPDKYMDFNRYATENVQSGKIPISRIDDVVSRILKVKFEMGLFENPYPLDLPLELVGGKDHRAVAREAVQKSMVILKNEDILPIRKGNVVITGSSAENMGKQCGGWTIQWQGRSGDITEGTTIAQGLIATAPQDVNIKVSNNEDDYKESDLIIVAVGEYPYAEWEGDREDIRLNKKDRDLISKIENTGRPFITILVSGRPMVVTDEIKMSDAFIASFLPGTEGEGVADIIYGKVKPTGRLSFSWPISNDQIPVNFNSEENSPLYPIGYGLTY